MKQLLLLIQRHRGVFATAAAAWFIITALAVWFVINVTRAKEQAENERNRATANEQKARRNAEIAAENERKATHHAEVAAQNAAEARAAEKVATERQEATRRALAKARIAVADAAYRNNNAREMQAALKEVPEDLRDADWSYLTAKSDVSIAKVLPGVELTGVAAHPKEPGVFAVGGEDGKVAILRARTSEVLLEFEPVFSPQKLPAIRGFKLAFSPDGERIAIGHNGTGILIHSARDGKKLVEWDSLRTGDLHFSPNGRLLLQEIHIHPHHNIALWDVTTGKQLWSRWNPEDKNLQGAVFTPDGKRIICIQRVGSFVILSVTDGALLKELTPQPGMPFPNQIALASDGKSFIAGGDDGSVLGISLGDGRVLFKGGPYGERIRQLAFTPDGSRIVAIAWHGDGRQSIQFFGGKSGKPLATLLGGNAAPNAVSVHPLSGEMLLTGKDSRLWDISTAPEIWTSDKPGPSAQFWGSDHILFASRKSNAAELWDLRESRIIWEPTPLREHNSAHISADGRYAAIPGAPLFILQRTDGIPEVISTKLSCQFQSIVRLSPDGSRIVIREKFGGSTAMVRDSMTGKKPCKLSPEGVVSFNDLGWVGGGTHIVGLATTNDKRGAPKSEEKIVLWDAATGQQLQSVVHPSAMDVLAVSPDGLSFAEAGADRLVRVRDAATLAVKHQFRAHDDRITTLAWHPKKPILATGSADFSVKIWNVETGRSLEEFHGLVNRPNAMSFSPGGTRLACSVNQEGTHVWEPLSLQPAP